MLANNYQVILTVGGGGDTQRSPSTRSQCDSDPFSIILTTHAAVKNVGGGDMYGKIIVAFDKGALATACSSANTVFRIDLMQHSISLQPPKLGIN